MSRYNAAYNDPLYKLNRAIVLAGSPRCAWPGCTNPARTADHIVPLSEGGTHALGNLRPSCGTCNSRGGAALSSAARRARRVGRRSRRW